MPHLVDSRLFEHLVADALDEVPDEFIPALENVVVVVEDHPPAGEDLLGLYEGVPMTDKSVVVDTFVLPDRITLFRIPLCEIATGADDLADWVRSTLFHELGHHLGLDEGRLEELGWA